MILLLPRLGVVSIVRAFRVDLSSTLPSATTPLIHCVFVGESCICTFGRHLQKGLGLHV